MENETDRKIQELMTSPKPAVFKGLDNPPNTNMCWLNSFLQIFICLPLFSQFDKIFQHGDPQITDSFLKMLSKWKQPMLITDCREFKNQRGAILNNTYLSNNQQDP